MGSAVVAGVATAFGDAMVGSYLATLGTLDSFWVQVILQPFKARIIVGEVSMKLLDCVPFHHNQLLYSTQAYHTCVRAVKG